MADDYQVFVNGDRVGVPSHKPLLELYVKVRNIKPEFPAVLVSSQIITEQGEVFMFISSFT